MCPGSRKVKSLSPQKLPERRLPWGPSQARARSVSVRAVATLGQVLGSAWKPKAELGLWSPVQPSGLQLPGSLAPPRPLWVPPQLWTQGSFLRPPCSPLPPRTSYFHRKQEDRGSTHSTQPQSVSSNPAGQGLEPQARQAGTTLQRDPDFQVIVPRGLADLVKSKPRCPPILSGAPPHSQHRGTREGLPKEDWQWPLPAGSPDAHPPHLGRPG